MLLFFNKTLLSLCLDLRGFLFLNNTRETKKSDERLYMISSSMLHKVTKTSNSQRTYGFWWNFRLCGNFYFFPLHFHIDQIRALLYMMYFFGCNQHHYPLSEDPVMLMGLWDESEYKMGVWTVGDMKRTHICQPLGQSTIEAALPQVLTLNFLRWKNSLCWQDILMWFLGVFFQIIAASVFSILCTNFYTFIKCQKTLKFCAD